jgi:hypothetical protein
MFADDADETQIRADISRAGAKAVLIERSLEISRLWWLEERNDMAQRRVRVLGKGKPPPEPGAIATSKLKTLPRKRTSPALTLKRGKNQSIETAAHIAEQNPKPTKKSS